MPLIPFIFGIFIFDSDIRLSISMSDNFLNGDVTHILNDDSTEVKCAIWVVLWQVAINKIITTGSDIV